MPWRCDGRVLKKKGASGRWLTKQICETAEACEREKRWLYAHEGEFESERKGKAK